MPEETVKAKWVVGSFKGENAKSVLAHAFAGIPYIIEENRGSRTNPEVIAAFRVVPDPVNGLPEHLIEVKDPWKIANYDKKRRQRQNGGSHVGESL